MDCSCFLKVADVILNLLTGRLPEAVLLTGRLPEKLVRGYRQMTTGRISKRVVDALACPTGKDREILWDATLAGFGVCAFPSGKKVYVAQFRKDGRSRRVAIGDQGRLTPNEARALALVMLGDVEKGADPAEQRRAARAVRTLREVSEEFLRLHVAQKRKERTHADYRRILTSYILPALGSKRIVDIRRVDVAKLHASLSAIPHQANRVLALISALWNWAAQREEVARDKNPASQLEKYREERRERFLTTEEFARLGDALREAETVGLPWVIDEAKSTAKHLAKADKRRTILDPHAVAAIRLLTLTGARLREILHAQWSEVDLGRGLVFLADSKTGAKPLYLSAAAQSVLAGIPRVDGNPYIITGANDGAPRADLKKPWAAVRRSAGLEGVRIHDLRHSFASIGAGSSMGLPIIGKLLGHSQASTTQRYAHLDVDPLRRAADSIGATISAAMSGDRLDNVVALPKVDRR
jgi:integrase